MKSLRAIGILAPVTFGSALIWANTAGRDPHEDEKGADHGLVQVSPRPSADVFGWAGLASATGSEGTLADESHAYAQSAEAKPEAASGPETKRSLDLPEPSFGRPPELSLIADRLERDLRTVETRGYAGVVRVAAVEYHLPAIDDAALAGLAAPLVLAVEDRPDSPPIAGEAAESEPPAALATPPLPPEPLAGPPPLPAEMALAGPPSASAALPVPVRIAPRPVPTPDLPAAEELRDLARVEAGSLAGPVEAAQEPEPPPPRSASVLAFEPRASPARPPPAPLGSAAAPIALAAMGTIAPPSIAPVYPEPTFGRPVERPPPAPSGNLAENTADSAPAASEAESPQVSAPNLDLSPGQQTFPARQGSPAFTVDDELILQLKVRGITATDTVIAYGTRDAVFLPMGELAMILDLAIRVSDDGHYASGWFLSEDRTVTIDLRQGVLTTQGRTIVLAEGAAQAFQGELYVRSDVLAAILPLDFQPDLRSQAVLLTTREPFPFEERMRREADRTRLAQRGSRDGERETWPREETPWLALSMPIGDVELRAVSDSQRGTRAEGDIRLAGDFAWMTAEAYLSATTRDGLVSSLLALGRRDVDSELLGPLEASEFRFGDVATSPMPLGLRGTSGRGAYVTNRDFQSFSVFDRIDLRGLMPDGYEVELYRNGVLLGSTAYPVNGQYEFLQVPVDYGLNVFRIVFYGPQGQRREEVRRISVGDGRLSPGAFEYSFGAVQNGTNLLGVEGPDFRPGVRYGDWQAVGEVAYGFSSALTGVASGAFYEDEGEQRWLATAGLRTGIGGLAVRADAGASDGGGYAMGLGLGGPALGGAFTFSHFEYGGDFRDEVRSFTSETLRRATEFDFNATLGFASSVIGTALPINLRARHLEFADGRRRVNAALRGSARLPGLIASNTFEFTHVSTPGLGSFSQLAGDFNLATFNSSRTQVRGAIGYRLLPEVELVQVSGSIDHAIDDRTVLSATAAYSIGNDEFAFGVSAIREFERFTLALDGQYAPQQGTYAVALRLGFSFGRDPLRERFFVSSPGKSASGALALRAFQDLDGDLLYGPGDLPLPEVGFSVFNNVAVTDAQGFARLGDLGEANPVTVQVDPSTLPDITMAPANRGVEIVPRPGRIHTLQFPIVEVSEIEGSVTFVDGENERGVSGLRLRLRNERDGTEYWARTERGGYFFYEQVLPGNYQVVIDPAQAERLGICLDSHEILTIAPQGSLVERNFTVRMCEGEPQ